MIQKFSNYSLFAGRKWKTNDVELGTFVGFVLCVVRGLFWQARAMVEARGCSLAVGHFWVFTDGSGFDRLEFGK